jgi:UDP-N-acetylmuramoylalanine--D-glutamate ligase
MKVAIVGFDTEGKVTYDFCKARGDDITICDQNTDLVVPEGAATQLGPDYLQNLDHFDQLIRTPGLHPAKIFAANPGKDLTVTSHMNLFFEHAPTKNIIGITGTKGKGTTSTLVTKILEAAGKDVRLGGNIGIPPLSFMHDLTAESWVVLELSSFQLIDLKYSPHLAAVLMVVPEHLDWHEDFEEYVAAKQQLFIHQQADDIAVYFADNETSLSVADASEGVLLPYFSEPGARIIADQITIDGTAICNTSEVRLLGAHNLQNICAAVTLAWQVAQDTDAIRRALTTFTGLPHRLELVRTIDEIQYYDDSFGTTPDTAIVAMESFKEPKVVILGGSDKGVSFENLAKTVAASNVRAVVSIGAMGPTIAAELQKNGFTSIIAGGKTMQEIVTQARGAAQAGDIVLLSTACASFDMFKNYKDRGDQFKQAVMSL